jgi:predicted phage replisome organizer
MGEVQWIKIYIDMFDKRKIKKLRRLPAGNELLLIWIMLLATAGKCNAGGMIYITENVPFTEEDLADELGFEIGTIKLALKAFEELDMITTTDDGFINVIGWEEYQNIDGMAKIREQTRKRVAACRERQRLSKGNDTCNVTVTERNAIEEDIEEEKEKEEENHSFVHSAERSEYDKERVKLKYLGGTLGQGVVLMSDEQFDDLLDKYSLDEIEKYMGIIVECEMSGKKFKKKTHYQAFIEMADKDRKVKK